MALKCFIPGLSFPGDSEGSVNVITCPVLDSSTGYVLIDPMAGHLYLTGTTQVIYSDNIYSIRSKLINDPVSGLISYFNSITGRTDGNTVQFVWLDDRGLL